MVTAKNKVNTFQKTSERHIPNDKYEGFVIYHIEIAAKCILIKPKAKCWVPWGSNSS